MTIASHPINLIDLDRRMKTLPMFGGEEGEIAYRDMDSRCEIYPASKSIFVMDWFCKGFGFGQAYLSSQRADTETLSPTFIAAVLRRLVLDAAWSHEGWRDEVEAAPSSLVVTLDNTDDQVAFVFEGGRIQIGPAIRNHGEVTLVDVSASPWKSQDAVLSVLFSWINSIPEWEN